MLMASSCDNLLSSLMAWTHGDEDVLLKLFWSQIAPELKTLYSHWKYTENQAEIPRRELNNNMNN